MSSESNPKKHNVLINYFSGTGNTKFFAEIMGEKASKLGAKVKTKDITPYNARQEKIPYDHYDLILFGFPIYAGRAPDIIKEWLENQNGKSKPCAMFFTYGGVYMGKAHQDTGHILNNNSFKIIGSAEFLAKHSFNVAPGCKLVPNRPNNIDLQLAKKYITKVLEKLEKENLEPIKLPCKSKRPQRKKEHKKEKNEKKPIKFPYPKRDNETCSMCLLCEIECPTRAFDAKTGNVDQEKCIRCMHCISICPDKVITIESYADFYERITEKFNISFEKESKFYV
ncbi:MAG: EFR1 family ferrodoxin [Asgard group archaeon]|nr:EFR1 family ferrodoxin [Asgard group archaeon]